MRLFRKPKVVVEDDGYDLDWEPGFPSHRPVPPDERDGIHVGDQVVLIPHHGAEWPVEVMGFTNLRCDMVVRWLGPRPLSATTLLGISTVCRAQLADVRKQATTPAVAYARHKRTAATAEAVQRAKEGRR